MAAFFMILTVAVFIAVAVVLPVWWYRTGSRRREWKELARVEVEVLREQARQKSQRAATPTSGLIPDERLAAADASLWMHQADQVEARVNSVERWENGLRIVWFSVIGTWIALAATILIAP